MRSAAGFFLRTSFRADGRAAATLCCVRPRGPGRARWSCAGSVQLASTQVNIMLVSPGSLQILPTIIPTLGSQRAEATARYGVSVGALIRARGIIIKTTRDGLTRASACIATSSRPGIPIALRACREVEDDVTEIGRA